MQRFILTTFAGLALAAPALAQALGAVRVTGGLNAPVHGTFAPGAANANTLYIVEQGGTVRSVNASTGAITSTFFTQSATLTPGFVSGGEQGLLGLAFHPNYDTNNLFYAYYTGNNGDSVRVDQYTRDPGTGTIGNRINVVDIPHPGQSNHNGGWIGFKPGDTGNNLYINTGDGGSGNDPPNNAQNTNVLLGKMLRVNVGTGLAVAGGYTIPAGNMTVNPNAAIAENPTNAVRPEIYAYGLRNPFRANFDRGNTLGVGRGNLFIGDVGQGAREEVSFIHSSRVNAGVGGTPSQQGINFGWRVHEGFNGPVPSPKVDYVPPIFDYANSTGSASVIGGQVYRGPATDGPAASQFNGTYIFADYYSNPGLAKIASFVPDPATGAVTGYTNRTAEVDASLSGTGFSITSISAFFEGQNGSLYFLDHAFGGAGQGEIFRIVPLPEPMLLLPVALAIVAVRRKLRG